MYKNKNYTTVYVNQNTPCGTLTIWKNYFKSIISGFTEIKRSQR